MTQPVVKDHYDDYDELSYVGLTIGSVAGFALVTSFLGAFIYMVLHSLSRGRFG